MVGDGLGVAEGLGAGAGGIADFRGKAVTVGPHLDIEVIVVVMVKGVAVTQRQGRAFVDVRSMGAGLEKDEAHAVHDAAFEWRGGPDPLYVRLDVGPDVRLEELGRRFAAFVDGARDPIGREAAVGAGILNLCGRGEAIGEAIRLGGAGIAIARFELAGAEHVNPGVELRAELGVEQRVVEIAAGLPFRALYARHDLGEIRLVAEVDALIAYAVDECRPLARQRVGEILVIEAAPVHAAVVGMSEHLFEPAITDAVHVGAYNHLGEVLLAGSLAAAAESASHPVPAENLHEAGVEERLHVIRGVYGGVPGMEELDELEVGVEVVEYGIIGLESRFQQLVALPGAVRQRAARPAEESRPHLLPGQVQARVHVSKACQQQADLVRRRFVTCEQMAQRHLLQASAHAPHEVMVVVGDPGGGILALAIPRQVAAPAVVRELATGEVIFGIVIGREELAA